MRVIMSQIGVFFVYFPGAIWTRQHLTVTLRFKDHWSCDVHDLAERLLYFYDLEISGRILGNRTTVGLTKLYELNR